MAPAVPRVVWTLWLQGWDTAPPLVRACLTSWQRRNPEWTIRALSREDVGRYLDLPSVYPSVDFSLLSPAAFSDMVRLALLSEYGGVWVDSTVFCARPLQRWLDNCLSTGFFAFHRPGPDRMISSWFLVARPHHPMVDEWRERVRDYWEHRAAPDGYFWLHQLFAAAYQARPWFREMWDATPKLSSAGPHYLVPYEPRLYGRLTRRRRAHLLSGTDPVYKLSHRGPQSGPTPGSVYEFFCNWADEAVLPDSRPITWEDRLLLLTERSSEAARWRWRRARQHLDMRRTRA
jgi:hypothetical protein